MGQTGGEAQRHMAVVKNKKKSKRDGNLQKRSAGGLRGNSLRE